MQQGTGDENYDVVQLNGSAPHMKVYSDSKEPGYGDEDDGVVESPLLNGMKTNAASRISMIKDKENRRRLRCVCIGMAMCAVGVIAVASVVFLYQTLDLSRREMGFVFLPRHIGDVLVSTETEAELRSQLMGGLNSLCSQQKCDALFSRVGSYDLSSEEDLRSIQTGLFESVNSLVRGIWRQPAAAQVPWVLMDTYGNVCRIMPSVDSDEEVELDCAEGMYAMYATHRRHADEGTSVLVLNTAARDVQTPVNQHLRESEARWTQMRWGVVVSDRSVHSLVEEVYCRNPRGMDAAARARIGRVNALIDVYASPDADAVVAESSAGSKQRHRWIESTGYGSEPYKDCTLHDRVDQSTELYRDTQPDRMHVHYMALVSAQRHVRLWTWDIGENVLLWKHRDDCPLPSNKVPL
jgi:hypothetical protein